MAYEQTILIVDDTSTNIEILLDLLKGYDLLVATNGHNALEIAKNEKLDLILLDIMMPEMDGYEVCERLKSNPNTSDIPIMFITAKTDEESIEKGFEVGALDYVAKPFKPKELISRVKTHLKINHLINNLEEVNEEVSHILNTTMEAVFVFDGEKCTDVNIEALKLFECKDKCDVIDKTFVDFAKLNLFEKDDDTPYEIEAIKCNGISFPALVRFKKLQLKSKKIGVFAVLDLSEIKDKELMLSQKTKMESMGEMITNIAHQWRQPLSVISTSASGMLLQKEFGVLTDELITELGGSIIESCDFLSQTIEDFQELTHSQKTDKDSFFLSSVIEDMKGVFGSHFDEYNLNLIVNIDDDFKIYSYKKGLEQVILNILKNSIDVLYEKKLPEKYIFINAFKHREQKTIIEIYDNGNGIDEEILDKIFEPYFTTKHKSQGTGLGLYSSFNIIKNMGGILSVENSEFIYNDKNYKGAKFTIKL